MLCSRLNCSQFARRPYDEWFREELACLIKKRYRLQGDIELRVADEVLYFLNKFGKLKPVTNELLTYEEYTNYDEESISEVDKMILYKFNKVD